MGGRPLRKRESVGPQYVTTREGLIMELTHADLCGDHAAFISYVYDECEANEQRRIEAHLATCAACATEVASLRGVRGTLAEWAPPEPAPEFRLVRVESPARRWFNWRPAPAWSFAAAAVLVLAAAAGVASLEITYGADGLVVRTGWSDAASSADAEAVRQSWRADLKTLEADLRREFAGRAAAAPVGRPAAVRGGSADASSGTVAANVLVERMRRLIEDSERRQQRDLALRFAQLMGEADAQREADLMRIEQQFGQLEGLTEADVVQHREIMDYLVRVAGR